MKKIILALAFFTSLTFLSCSSDDKAESNGTSTGDFLPLKTNNEWTYIIESESLTNLIKIVGTTTFNSTAYYEFTDNSEAFPFIIKHWFAKKGATYVLKTDDSTINDSGVNVTVKSYEIPILKDDYDVDVPWTGSVSPKVTFSANGQTGVLPFKVTYTGKNFFRGEITLNGENYQNVIKTRINLVIKANDQVTTSTEEYWYAENIGIIKLVTYNTDGTKTEKNIYNFQLN